MIQFLFCPFPTKRCKVWLWCKQTPSQNVKFIMSCFMPKTTTFLLYYNKKTVHEANTIFYSVACFQLSGPKVLYQWISPLLTSISVWMSRICQHQLVYIYILYQYLHYSMLYNIRLPANQLPECSLCYNKLITELKPNHYILLAVSFPTPLDSQFFLFVKDMIN